MSAQSKKQRLALVFGNLPTVEEIDQFMLLQEAYDIQVVSSESICGFLTQNSHFQDLTCIALPDHDENPTYLPGLEKVLADFDLVVVKERLGLYAYQAVKAKWKSRFRLLVWVDNLAPYPAEDVNQMRTIRREVTNAADLFIVQSNAAKLALEIEGVESARIVSMLPFIATRVKRSKKARAEALSQLRLAESDLVIVHFGQIEWEEGLVDLVSAVKLASQEDASFKRRIRLIFCGIGSFAPELREVVLNLGIDDLVYYMAPNRKNVENALLAADALYFCRVPARDRVDGDPYILLSAMAHEIPIIANRSPIVDEFAEKHRLDFCVGSVKTLSQALLKACDAQTLKNDIAKKNLAVIQKRFTREACEANMLEIFRSISAVKPAEIARTSLDHQVLEVEARFKNKQYLAAIDIIDSIFKLPEIPTHHQAHLYRLCGDCFAKLGDNEGAKDAYVRAAELDPYSAKAYIGLGTIGLVRQSHDIAVLHFQKAVSLAPEDEMANLGLGLAFQGMEEYSEATRWVVKALDMNVENTAAIFTLVKLAYQTNHYQEAERGLRQYLARHPNDYNMIYTLGGIQFKQGQYQDVLDLMAGVIKADPMDSRAHTLVKQARRALEEEKASNG